MPVPVVEKIDRALFEEAETEARGDDAQVRELGVEEFAVIAKARHPAKAIAVVLETGLPETRIVELGHARIPGAVGIAEGDRGARPYGQDPSAPDIESTPGDVVGIDRRRLTRPCFPGVVGVGLASENPRRLEPIVDPAVFRDLPAPLRRDAQPGQIPVAVIFVGHTARSKERLGFWRQPGREIDIGHALGIRGLLVRVVLGMQSKEAQLLATRPRPTHRAEDMHDIVVLGFDPSAVENHGEELVGHGDFGVHFFEIETEANRIEILIPPPFPRIEIALATHLEPEGGIEEIAEVKPHFAAFDEPIVTGHDRIR